MFTTKSNQIFSQAIADYHRFDKVDMPIDNPYKNGSIEYLLYLKNWIDTVQWHLEDIIRDPHIDPEIALKIKRRIDPSCAGNLTRAGGKNIKHLLVQILGREEVPDVRHSLWNRVRAGR